MEDGEEGLVGGGMGDIWAQAKMFRSRLWRRGILDMGERRLRDLRQ